MYLIVYQLKDLYCSLKAKTLRGHDASIVTVLAVVDVMNWDNPRPPMIISLCSAGKVRCWDTLQVCAKSCVTYSAYLFHFLSFEAKVLWSLDEGLVTAIAADQIHTQLASSYSNGTVTIWNLSNFTLQNTLSSISGRTVMSLKYKHLDRSTLPSPYLIVGVVLLTCSLTNLL